mmetsp:Transcript_86765/g.176633  ORF Transcript_86765/g.176633 Transcript_86765/m.176633 type:complete len:133 (-) Transcript_86765:406-804(-)
MTKLSFLSLSKVKLIKWPSTNADDEEKNANNETSSPNRRVLYEMQSQDPNNHDCCYQQYPGIGGITIRDDTHLQRLTPISIRLLQKQLGSPLSCLLSYGLKTKPQKPCYSGAMIGTSCSSGKWVAIVDIIIG